MRPRIEEVRFYLDVDTGLAHCRDHGVSEREAQAVLRSPVEDLPARDGARMALGPTATGRILKVIYVRDSENPFSVFVITAYDLTGKSLTAYRRRRRGRG